MTDHSGAIFVWETDPPTKETIAYVRDYISKDQHLTDLDEPKELMFAHIPLTKGKDAYEGPAVVLSGNEEMNGFNAAYYPYGFKKLTFKLEDFPNIEDAMEEAIMRMGDKEETPEEK